MPRLKSRSKRTYLRLLQGLKVTPEVKSILASIAAEVEGSYSDAVTELRTSLLVTFYAVAKELKEHDTEYHHITDPKLKEAVHKAIISLGGKTKE